jgi:hypothetical protein
MPARRSSEAMPSRISRLSSAISIATPAPVRQSRIEAAVAWAYLATLASVSQATK